MNRIFIALVCLTSMLIATKAKPDSPTKLKIGIIVPLSGPLAEYGFAIKNGIEMAAKDNPKTAAQTEWFYEDSKYDSKVAVSAYAKLLTLNDVDLAMTFGGPMSEVLAPIAERKRRAFLITINEPRVVKSLKYVVRFSNPAADYGKLVSDWLKKRNTKKVGIIRAENQYLDCMLDGLKQTLPSDIQLDIVDSFQPSEQDFRSVMPKLSQSQYDAIGVFLVSGQVSTFYRQMKEQHVSKPSFGTDFFESRTEIAQAGGAMEGAIFPNNVVSDEFREKYTKQYGNDNQITWAGYGHDLYLLVGKLAGEFSEKPKAEAVIEALQEASTVNGVMGRFKYQKTPEGDSYFGFSVMLKKVQGPQFVPYS